MIRLPCILRNFLKIIFKLERKFCLWGLLGSLISIPKSGFKIQDGGSNMADEFLQNRIISPKFVYGVADFDSKVRFQNSRWRIQYGGLIFTKPNYFYQFVYGGFWGRLFRFQSQVSKIQDGGSNMADLFLQNRISLAKVCLGGLFGSLILIPK